MKLRRRVALGVVLAVSGALLAGCNGKTVAPTNVKYSSARLQASVSCDGTSPCYYYFRTWDFSAGQWTYTKVRGPFGKTNGYVTVGEDFSFHPGTGNGWLAYQVCGKGDGVTNWTCVGPNGGNSFQYFQLNRNQSVHQG